MDIQHLRALCDEFKHHPGIAELSDGLVAKYQCSKISEWFVEFLKRRDIDSCCLGVEGYLTPNKTGSAYAVDYDWNRFGHTVVIVDNWWVDWTVRQMDVDKPFPFISNARTEINNWKAMGL